MTRDSLKTWAEEISEDLELETEPTRVHDFVSWWKEQHAKEPGVFLLESPAEGPDVLSFVLTDAFFQGGWDDWDVDESGRELDTKLGPPRSRGQISPKKVLSFFKMHAKDT